MEFLGFLACIVIGYLIGVIRTIKKFETGELVLESLEETEFYNPETGEQTHPDKHIVIDIESHEDFIFIYNADTGKYMAHGKSAKEVEDKLRERFPGVTFGASEESMREIGLL